MSGLRARVATLLLALALAGCGAVAAQVALSFASPELFAAMFGTHENRPEFRQAAPLIQKQDWQGLVALGRRQLDADPRSGMWWELTGYGYLQLSQLAEARNCFEHATRLVPEEVDSWNLYAHTLRRQGDDERALRAAQHALEVDPYSATAYVILGDTQRALGRPRLALQAYGRAIELDNSNAFAWYGAGLVAKAAKNRELYDQAKQNLEKLSKPMAESLEKA